MPSAARPAPWALSRYCSERTVNAEFAVPCRNTGQVPTAGTAESVRAAAPVATPVGVAAVRADAAGPTNTRERLTASRPISTRKMAFMRGPPQIRGAGSTTGCGVGRRSPTPVSYTHLRAHETVLELVCRLLLEKKK